MALSVTKNSKTPHAHRVDDLWFDDGTLILQAGLCLFRVYKGLLGVRCPLFLSTISLAIPQTNEPELMDGCPVIHVHEAPDDVTYFLRAIHQFDFFENGKETEFGVVAGILRLSTKYQVPHLRRRAIQHLITAYPTTLQAWDSRNTTRTIPAIPYVPFAVLELARLTDVEIVVPAAMYCCCTSSIKDIFDGVPWGGSQLDMSWADKRTCIIGRQELLSAKQNTICAFLKPGNVPSCDTIDSCNTGRLKTVFTNTDDEYCDPLWDRFDWTKFAQAVCPTCLAASRSSYEKARKDLWNNLPSIFNLRSWTELEASPAQNPK